MNILVLILICCEQVMHATILGGLGYEKWMLSSKSKFWKLKLICIIYHDSKYVKWALLTNSIYEKLKNY